MTSRPWNFRFNLDEWNTLVGSIFTDLDRSLCLQGLGLGINGGDLPDEVPGAFARGWDFGKAMRDEVDEFRVKQAAKGVTSAANRAAKYGTSQPSKDRTTVRTTVRTQVEDSSNPNHNPQSTIDYPPSPEPQTSSRSCPKPPKIPDSTVEAIYQAYPKHEAKQDALKAIRTALAKVAPDILLEAVQAYAAAVAEWSVEDREYIPLPASWIRKGKWEDDRKNWIRGFPTHKPPAVPGIAHQPPEWAQSKIAGLKLELPEAERQVRIAKAQPFNYDLESAERALTKIKAEILKLGGTV
jgi:hypothetical protein